MKDQTTGHDWVLVSSGRNNNWDKTRKVRYYDATEDDGTWKTLDDLPFTMLSPAGAAMSIFKFSEFEVVSYIYKVDGGSPTYPINEGLFYSTLTRTWSKASTPFSRNIVRVQIKISRTLSNVVQLNRKI